MTLLFLPEQQAIQTSHEAGDVHHLSERQQSAGDVRAGTGGIVPNCQTLVRKAENRFEGKYVPGQANGMYLSARNGRAASLPFALNVLGSRGFPGSKRSMSLIADPRTRLRT